jgi:hypothetical protein
MESKSWLECCWSVAEDRVEEVEQKRKCYYAEDWVPERIISRNDMEHGK